MFKSQEQKLLNKTLFSKIIFSWQEKEKDKTTTIKDIINEFHHDSILLTLLFFSIPIAVPLPYPPGFTTIIGVPIIFLTIQMIIGSKLVYLPKKVKRFKVKNSLLITMSKKIYPWLVKCEKLVTPRFTFMSCKIAEKILGILCFVSGLFIALPLPFTNAIPAFGVALISFGLLNRDGIVIMLGIIASIFGWVVALSFTIGGFKMIKVGFQYLTSFF